MPRVSEGCADCLGMGAIEDTEGHLTGYCSTCGGAGVIEHEVSE